ncbi:MAG TPA: hypothetical protein PLP07_00405 [Pyrinomonadaceae bacterium]|jgi:hypothetical protein|nr:hypothetical protein [Chloracidobacterium sp.]MBP9934236.1 hypothetical protein [Pyrinomonadaceae bacterium]MBK7801568.1 hypothetical protein [Chloracidobacterium sp.]MBK9436884.1 hypothetical protein [Chloracidobacterium sp.]MBK9766539.1 hypothetical protein [Chloracidobacterium sp.]
MYPRAKFVEILHEIRQEMSQEADYDVVLFAEMVRTGDRAHDLGKGKSLDSGRSVKMNADAGPELTRSGK